MLVCHPRLPDEMDHDHPGLVFRHSGGGGGANDDHRRTAGPGLRPRAAAGLVGDHDPHQGWLETSEP